MILSILPPLKPCPPPFILHLVTSIRNLLRTSSHAPTVPENILHLRIFHTYISTMYQRILELHTNTPKPNFSRNELPVNLPSGDPLNSENKLTVFVGAREESA